MKLSHYETARVIALNLLTELPTEDEITRAVTNAAIAVNAMSAVTIDKDALIREIEADVTHTIKAFLRET